MAGRLLAHALRQQGFVELVGATSDGRSTNHPEPLESALALWSERIDQATDFPVSEEWGRAKFIMFYSG